jgi:phosphatidylinositol alpha-1,6-mannosyltransferase
LSLRKGFDQVIRALPGLLQRGVDVHYAIIGKGESADHLKVLAQEMGVQERVHFLGSVMDEELPGWYYTCDVFAMPNREIDGDTEGFGMVFLEAAACGKPTIAGEAGGTGAAVLNDVTGLRVNGSSIDQVQQALEKLLSDDALNEKLGQAGLKRAQNLFDWNMVAQKTASIVD